MNNCKTCANWAPYLVKYPMTDAVRRMVRSDTARLDGGICESPKFTEDYGNSHAADMLVYPYIECGEFWTGAEFGCVHHKPVENSKN